MPHCSGEKSENHFYENNIIRAWLGNRATNTAKQYRTKHGKSSKQFGYQKINDIYAGYYSYIKNIHCFQN